MVLLCVILDLFYLKLQAIRILEHTDESTIVKMRSFFICQINFFKTKTKYKTKNLKFVFPHTCELNDSLWLKKNVELIIRKLLNQSVMNWFRST